MLMLIAVLLTGSHVFAHHFEVDGIYYNFTSDNYTVGVTYMGNSYDSYSDEYTGNIIIPDSVTYRSYTYSVTSIRSEAFRDCTNLNSITIPNSVTRIENEAFNGCTSLKELRFEDGESDLWLGFNRFESSGVGDGLFDDCYKIESIYLGRNIDYRTEYNYGYSPFYNLPCLKTVIIGNSVTCITNSAFENCNSLTSVTIPKSVTVIENSAFRYCVGLVEIINEATTPQTVNRDAFYQVPTTATLYVPIGSIEAYKNADGWKNFKNILEKEFSGVESTHDENMNVSVKNGNIVVNGSDNANVEVYSTNGQCVYRGTATIIPITAKGLYIVKANGKSHKIML